MRGSYTNFGSQRTEAVEEAVALHRERCELRLAKIQNGAHPDYKNGPVKGPALKKGKRMR